MKRLICAAVIGACALAVHAQGLTCIGYEQTGIGNGEITTRLDLQDLKLDMGLGLIFDNSRGTNDEKFGMTVSAYLLKGIHDHMNFTGYLGGGLRFEKYQLANDNVGFSIFLGYIPEVVLMEHIAVAVRLGLRLQAAPDFKVYTYGQPISIVDGINFKIMF